MWDQPRELLIPFYARRAILYLAVFLPLLPSFRGMNCEKERGLISRFTAFLILDLLKDFHKKGRVTRHFVFEHLQNRFSLT